VSAADAARAAAFIDRDGVVNELVSDPVSGLPESPLRPDDVQLMPGAAEALKRLAAAGWLLVGVSNQPGAAKGFVPVEAIGAVQQRVEQLLAAEGARFDAFKMCLHHPEGVVPELTADCECRKPKPGMLLEAARELGIDLERSWMIGDTDRDVLAGTAAGCQTVLVRNRGSLHKRAGNGQPDAVVADLPAATDVLLQSSGVD
jgi:D-glycero-D-manno-heptose 1,7-bisphosphate phosphatase